MIQLTFYGYEGVAPVYLFLWRTALLFLIQKYSSSIDFLFIIYLYLLLSYSFPPTYNFTYLLFGFSKYQRCLLIFIILIRYPLQPFFISYYLLLISDLMLINLSSIHCLQLLLTRDLCTVAHPFIMIHNSIQPDPFHGF